MCYNTHIRSTSSEVASKSRNGFVHPMIPFLLASALTCPGAQYLIDDVQKDRYLPPEEKADVIELIKLNSEEGCWDAND